MPCLLGIWVRKRNAKKFNSGRTKHANNKEETRNRRIQKFFISLRRSLRDGLYIELHKRPSVSELMDDARKKAASPPPVVEGEDKEEVDEEGSNNEEDVDEGEVEVDDNMLSSIVEEGKDYEEVEEEVTDVDVLGNRSIGPGCPAKEKEVRAHYNKVTGDKVVLVLRLALGLLAAGHCTVDVETTVLKTAEALKLPTPRLSVGHRLLQAQFGQAPPHLLTCKRDFVFSMLKDLQMLADSLTTGEIDPTEAHLALEVLNQMLATPLPYGWIIYDLVFLGIGPWATVAAYYGSYWDMLGAICLSPITVLTYRLCEKLKISHLEEILVPFNLGLFAPLIWRFCNGGQDLCHITPMYMGALLIHLPGAELVWGAIEVLQGSVIHGASRLIKALIQATSLAVFLTLGWQVFGRNLSKDWLQSLDAPKWIGAVASLPESSWCEETFPQYYPDYMTWYFVIGVYNMPLNILCLANVFIPVRDFIGPFLVGQVGMLSLGYLQFQCTPDTCELPPAIQNILSAYAATWVAMVVEVLSGLPSPISVIPVLFIFAPGSAAVLSTVGTMHRVLGDNINTNTSSWEDLTKAAFTYGVGIFLAEQTWKPFLKAQFKARREAAYKKKKVNVAVQSDDQGGSNISVYNNRNSTVTFDFDEYFHSPQMIAHGKAFHDRSRVKGSRVKRLLSIKRKLQSTLSHRRSSA